MSLALAKSTLARIESLQNRDSDFNGQAYGGYSLENPRTSWDRIFEVEPTYTGKNVTQQTAMQSMAVWACVRIIANAIGKIPFLTYQRSDEGKVRAPEHYLWELLKVQANPYQTAFRFKRMMQAWLCLWGNAYAEVEISGRGQVVALWPWRPDRVQMWSGALGNPPEIPNSLLRDLGGGIFYTYTRNDGTMITLPAHYILHLRGLETDGYQGLSPIGAARQSIGLALAAEEYGARFFGNNGRPGGFLSSPTKLSVEGRKHLRESFEDLHRGLRGAHRIGLLEEGLKYTDVGVPPEDMQFLQTRQFQAIDIARLFGVPPHKIAELSRATFSNIEHQSIEFVQDCLGDWMASWESECTSTLLSTREQQSIFLEFFPEYLMRGDLPSRYAAYNIGRNGGWLSINDVREKESMNRIEGGDEYMQPLNMENVAAAPAEGDDPEGDQLDGPSTGLPALPAIAAPAAAPKKKTKPAAAAEPGTGD
jgi:HK97 family phage portal protein